jgi:LacI family transcriptional regulator
MATIKEVARKAGVSVGTVSNVLRGSVRVRSEVRERVDHAIRSLDYHPNQIARSLKTRQTRLLGMVISDITNPFFPQLVRGAEDAALQHGYLLIASNTDDQVEREKQVMSVMRTQCVDGILLVVAPSDGESGHIRNMLSSKIPVVCLDRLPRHLRTHSVVTDAVYGAEMCMRHLISVGHRRIGMVNGNLLLQTAQDRLEGYKNALGQAGIPIEPGLILAGDFRFETGYLLTKQLLLSGRNPTALFVANCMMGLGALKAIKELGFRCPEDLALAVFDDVPGNGSFSPEITTVIQPAYELGHRGTELLIGHIESGEPEEPVQIRLMPELRIRESTLPRGATACWPSSPARSVD